MVQPKKNFIWCFDNSLLLVGAIHRVCLKSPTGVKLKLDCEGHAYD